MHSENNLAIEVTDLRYTYEDGTHALNSVSFSATEGESVGVVGPNGAGKSTLIHHLSGFLTGDGQVNVRGVTVSKKTARAIRRTVGVVFQDPDNQLFMPTVFDDVAFGPLNLGLAEDAVRARVDEALEAVRGGHLVDKAPHHLSEGEKRSIALAAVLAMEPEILILDEPTSGLDPRSRRRLIDLLKDMKQTRLIATHDLEMIVELCPRAMILDEGRIVADGEVGTLFRDADLLAGHGLEIPPSLR